MADSWTDLGTVVQTAPSAAKKPATGDAWSSLGTVVKPAKAETSGSYEPTTLFQDELDRTVGRGKWRDTGDYRTPQREQELGAQGAGTVRGGLSNHSRGMPAAPGAHDIVPLAGESWDDAVARIRKSRGVAGAFVEEAQGGQGRHIHVDMADLNAGDWSKLGQKVTPSAPAPPAAGGSDAGGGKVDPSKLKAFAQGPQTPGRISQPFGIATDPSLKRGAAGRYAQEELQSQVLDPAKKLYGDYAPGGSARQQRNPLRVTADDWSHLGTLIQISNAPLHAAVIRPAAAAMAHIPGMRDEQKNEGIVGTSLMGLGPEMGERGGAPPEGPRAPPPSSARRAPPETDARGYIHAETEHPDELVQESRGPDPAAPEGSARSAGSIVGGEADPAERVDNAIFRLGNHATADKIEALQAVRDTPPEVRDPEVQERLTHALEQRLIDPEAQLPEDLQEAEEARRPWAEMQRTNINEIREKMAARGATEEEMEEYAPDSGYVPRRVEGKSPGIDPADPLRRSPLAISGKNSLTRTTGSMRERNQIVFERPNGERAFEHRNPTNDEWRPGMQLRHPVTGEVGTVRHATIEEIEAAGATDRDGNPLKYHKNALVNTIDEALRTARVNRNLDVLDELTKGLKEEGLAHQLEWHRKNEQGQWVRMKADQPAPEGFQELPHIPQLRGWAFDPRVAEVLKDYYPGPDEPLDSVIAKVNRALNASLFITPFPHIKNVATMGFIGRGWDNLNLVRGSRTAAKAMKEVLTMGPRYRRFLREGSALQAGDEATRNFYQTLLKSAAKGIAGDPELARATGLNPVELGKALYAASHKVLWNVNDMILLQRQLELEEKGMATRDAIKESERWIANYRIPSRIMNQRWASQLMSDGKWINFGRYTYGKLRAIGEAIKQLGVGTGPEKMDALGKVVAAGVAALFIFPLMDKMLQKATGNPKAKFGRGGELAPVDALTDKEKDFAGKVSSILTPAPLWDTAEEARSNHSVYDGRTIRDPNASALGQGVELGDWAAGKYYPARLGLDALKPGGVSKDIAALAGGTSPTYQGMKAGTAKRLRAQAKSRERKDPLETELRRLMP